MNKFKVPVILTLALVGTGIMVPAIISSDDVTIDLDYPESYQVGELITIKADSNADSLIWKILPQVNFRIINNEILFSSTKPIDYTIIVTGSKGNKLNCQIFTLKYQNKTVLTPFQAKVKSWLPPNYNKKIAKNLANSFRMATTVTKDLDSLIMATMWANKEALGSDLETWRPFLKSLEDYLQVNSFDTFEEHVKLWQEVAFILEQ